MSAGKLPEWPVPFDDPNWNAVHRLPYWESRCRLAVEALDDVLCLADIHSEKQTKLASDALKAIGPLPPEGK